MTERDRKNEFNEAYEQGWSAFSSWQAKAKSDIEAVLVDAFTARDRNKLLKQGRDKLSIPLIRRNVKMISGYQRKNRLTIKYDPIEGADEETANQLTGIGSWSLGCSNGYNVISDAFENALITGINLVNLYNDREYYTKLDRIGYNQFILDPHFTKIDLSDCHYGILRKHISRQAAKILLPGKETFINGLKEGHNKDEKFSNYPTINLYGEKLLTYDEFQQRTTKEQKVIIDPNSGAEYKWSGASDKLNYILFEYPHLKVITRHINTVEVTGYLNGEEVFNSIDPFGIVDFSFTPIIAYFYPDYDRLEDKLQGIVRGLVDSQRASDKRVMSMVNLFEAQIGAGIDVEENALIDDADAFKTGSGSPRFFKEGAIAGGKYKDRMIPDIPPGMFQLHDLFDKTMPKIVNINDEMFGMAEDGRGQIAGVLAKLRQGAGLVGLHDLFDNLSMSQKIIGKKMAKLIQQYPPERVQRILNKPPSQSFYIKDFGQYDCTAVEGMLTDTQRNMFYSELVSLKELGLKLQDPAPISWPMLFKYAPVSLKSELLQEIQKLEQQKQQQGQKAEQLQQILQQLGIQKLQSEIAENNQTAAERQTQAVENQATAMLNRIKTAVEIKNMDKEPLMELIKLLMDMEKLKISKEKEKRIK